MPKISSITKTAETWDRLWDEVEDLESFFDVKRTKHKWTKYHLNLIDSKLKDLPKDSLFLEAGCGMGQWCMYANREYKIKSVGVDVANRAIRRLRKYVKENNLKDIEFIKDDLRKTKLASNTFDLFVCLGVIEHFSDSKKLVDSLFKITKKNGEGLISVPNIYSFHTITRPIGQLLSRFGLDRMWNIGYEKSFSPRGIRKLVEKSGFKVVDFGVIPTGGTFGCFLNHLPLIGKRIERLSYWIENKQSTFGFIIYVMVKKG